MKFKRPLILFFAWLLMAGAALAGNNGEPHRPCIIIIQCHGLAAADLSCYGQTNYLTPNLDRMAKAGIRFTHYTGGITTPATIAMLLNGQATGQPVGLANLAQRLRQNGYHTGLFGEWGLPGKPWRRGFDDFAGFLDANGGRNYYADHLWRYAPNSIFSANGKHLSAYVGREMIYPNMGGKQGEYIPGLLNKAMLNFVRINQPDWANHYRPFFLMLNLPAPRPAKAGKDDFPVPTDAPFSSENWPQAARNRAALITRLDDGIGQLFHQLKKLQMTNNVAVFFSSSSAPKKFADTNLDFLLPKSSFRDAKTKTSPRLPMLVYWPGTIPAGRVSDYPWTAADFAPTVLQIADVHGAKDFRGHTILPVLEGTATAQSPKANP